MAYKSVADKTSIPECISFYMYISFLFVVDIEISPLVIIMSCLNISSYHVGERATINVMRTCVGVRACVCKVSL